MLVPFFLKKNTMENILSKIKEITPNFIITGSLSLIKFGVIDRDAKDIDIVVSKKEDCLKFTSIAAEFKDKIIHLNNDSATDDEINSNSYTKIRIDGVGVCVFFREDIKNNCIPMQFGEFWYLDPIWAIEAKRKFIANYMKLTVISDAELNAIQKHLDDIKKYYQWTKQDLPF